MRPPHLPPKKPEELTRLYEEFHLQYGITLSQWATLEETLGEIFNRLCNFEEWHGMGPALFYSGRSFATRADLLSAAIRTAKVSADLTDLLRGILKKARQLSTSRNTIAHGVPTHYAESGLPYQGWRIKSGEETWSPGGVSIDELKIARENYRELAVIGSYAFSILNRSRRKGLKPPQEYLAQVQALPSDAFAPSEGQSREAPSSPPQSSRP